MDRLRPCVCALACVFALVTGARAQEPAPVEVATLQPSGRDHILDLSGNVTAQRRAELSPRVSGLVAAIAVDVGDRVRTGQLLLELDDALARLANRRDQAQLEEARTRVNEARRLHGEARSLVDKAFLPETRLPASQAEVDIARATEQRIAAQARESAERVTRHRVSAPFDGVIVRRGAELGEWVDTGDAVFELVATRPLRIDVQVPQERFAEISADTPVAVMPDALPDTRLPGRVAARVPVGDATARTFLVRVLVDDANDRIAPGMSAHVQFRLGEGGGRVSVPRDAVLRHPDGRAEVWLATIDGDGQRVARRREVRVGRTLGELIEVAEGLSAGQQVVIRGNERLREGQALRVVAER
ncbi:MAG: efflux RND transporter periplasmic adaptor subunit [Zoogloeaceae bacterium]|nr:efflux RND transporter periplasmic adaptor subunit [Rhodocyclaceae bacterium]MCP5235934.1 efflux RND transporter periplasmic adaptor subunit [Zoogloeaceae bacterium]